MPTRDNIGIFVRSQLLMEDSKGEKMLQFSTSHVSKIFYWSA